MRLTDGRDVMKTDYVIAFVIILALIVCILILRTPDEKPVIFTEWYSVNRYHIAGTESYQYVIEFVFESEKDSITFIKKFERLRQ